LETEEVKLLLWLYASRVGARMLAVLGSVYTPVVSVVYTLMVAKHLPTEVLATLIVFNAGYATALTMLSYVTV
jgi:hypothetical protein